MTTERLLQSANWVRHELLVRLAHRIRDFQQLPFFVGTNPHIEYVYGLYWSVFSTLRNHPTIRTETDNLAFCQLLRDVLEDGLVALPRLAQGLSESATYYDDTNHKDLDLFLNRMLRSRISRRLLAEQHLALTDNGCSTDDPHWSSDGYVGIIFMHCSASESVARTKELVYQHIHHYHADSNTLPVIDVRMEHHLDYSCYHKGKNEILFAYVPEQLEHILYEVLDNAVRYTIKRHPQSPPAIQVTVSSNETDVFFRVSDQAGGIEGDRYRHLWSYQARSQMGDFDDFKAVQKVPTSIDERASQASHHHLGIGLTLSRIYAEYWGGELEVMTMDGYGTDVYVRIPRLGTHIENLGMGQHPVFTTTTTTNHTSILKKKKTATLRLKSTNPQQDTAFHHGWSQSHMIQS
ncbi:MAG: branched-chain alpha-ketoacid dehydrogenase [Benjaminiella poitrasii]|nr:MAG: branched-chain alpha-ketoacid dehydrogenase [Benjaminiella poitrasii]